MENKRDFGVLYGQKTTEDALLIYSSYTDSKASPLTGDFIVLAPRDEDGIKFLARVEAEIYDEDPIFKSQDKTLIAVHYARIAERELSERDKQKMFSYTYKVNILGSFTEDGSNFSTAVRKLPVVSYHARHLKPREFSNIINKNNEQGMHIGNMCIGNEQRRDEILFDVNKLREKRTMVFAQSGFGKTNFIKVLLGKMIKDSAYGKLIFDLNGEYFIKSKNTNGLGDINASTIKRNLVVFSDKDIPDEYISEKRFDYKGKVLLNMKQHMTVGDILTFAPGFTEVMKSFLTYLDDTQVGNFLKEINSYSSNPARLHKDFGDFFGDLKKNRHGEEEDAVSARKTIQGIKKRIASLIEDGKGIHHDSSTMMEDVFAALKAGKTVVIDLSLKDSYEANVISTIICRKLFSDNKMKYTESAGSGSSITETVVFVEEAQNVLSEEFVRSNANPFVRIAKEGRKFGIGLVAITQRPSAISEEIRTQAENFFSFYMGNTDDIRALVKSNINFDGVIAKFIQRETINGNMYMVSSKQDFALPIRVIHFEKHIEDKIYSDCKVEIR
jgi:DNA helicase HerA-like ATPase